VAAFSEMMNFLAIPDLLFAFALIFFKRQQDYFNDMSKLEDKVVVSLFQ